MECCLLAVFFWLVQLATFSHSGVHMPMNRTTQSGHGWGLLASSSKAQHAHNQADEGNFSVEFLLLRCVKLTLGTDYDRDYLERGRPTEEVRVMEVQAKYVMSQ